MCYVFILLSCCVFSAVGAMVVDVEKQQRESTQMWYRYKTEIKELKNQQLMRKTPSASNLFDTEYVFTCKYMSGSNKELLIMKQGVVRSKDPSYYFNFCRCKWVKCYGTFTTDTCCSLDTSSCVYNKEVYDKWFIHYSQKNFCDVNSIVSRCLRYVEQKRIPYLDEYEYVVSDDFSRAACITDDGVVYVFAPGQELAMYVPKKYGHDVNFNFN